MDSIKKVTQDHPEAINLVHMGVVAPLLGYVGYQMKQAADGKLTNLAPLGKLGLVLMIVAVIILVYHGFLASQKMETHHGKDAAATGTAATGTAAAVGGSAKEGYMRASR